MEVNLKGNPISLKEKLGQDRYEDISNFFKRELGCSLEELEKGVKVIKMDFSSSLECLAHSVGGFYSRREKEVWITDEENLETLVHEFTHVHQHRRKGVISIIKKKINILANKRLLDNNKYLLYLIDPWEMEARRMASKYLNK